MFAASPSRCFAIRAGKLILRKDSGFSPSIRCNHNCNYLRLLLSSGSSSIYGNFRFLSNTNCNNKTPGTYSSYRRKADSFSYTDTNGSGHRFTRVNAFLSDSGSQPKRCSPVSSVHFPFSTSAAAGPPHDDKKIKAPATADHQRQVADMKILRTLAGYLWMKDNLEFRLRVIAALGFLVGAKILNVQVPFLFKLAVDWLTSATGNATALASFNTANSTLLALFATPTAVIIGYGIARAGASAFNGIFAM